MIVRENGGLEKKFGSFALVPLHCALLPNFHLFCSISHCIQQAMLNFALLLIGGAKISQNAQHGKIDNPSWEGVLFMDCNQLRILFTYQISPHDVILFLYIGVRWIK